MKILIHIPSSTIAGGSEALHQLCDALSENFETYVCYFNDSSCEIPEKFKIYNIKKSDYFDNPKTIHIVPETAIKYFYDKISKGIKVIYWLSVDNYLGLKDYNPFFKILRYLKTFKKRLSINKLNNCYHLSQSEYSSLFLKKKGISSYFIGDYTRDDYFNVDMKHSNKQNIIIYNPRKGFHFTKKIIDKCKYKFIPLQNMSNNEIIELMKVSKIYIDFGRFPGKDRIPREAVSLDNIIIIGKRGAGINDIDFPIPESFKVNTNNFNFQKTAIEVIRNSLDNYHSEIKKFDKFKNIINQEEKNFRSKTKASIKDLISKSQ